MITLKEFHSIISAKPGVTFQVFLPDLAAVPPHFHVTEVGRVRKDFIDCGGTMRHTDTCVLQVWVANDTDHRLETTKLDKIIQKGASLFPSTDIPLEIEYDNGVISQYPVQDVEVTESGIVMRLATKHTACLAPELCAVDLPLVTLNAPSPACGPGTGCC